MTADEAISKAARMYLPATYRRILERLEEKPDGVEGIASYLGVTNGSTYKLICKLKSLGVVCVIDYPREHDRGPWTKTYGLGDKDARPPKKASPAERSRKWRARQIPDQEVVRLGMFGI